MNSRFRLYASLAGATVTIVATVAAFSAAPAHACSCLRHSSPAAFVTRTAAIFEGVPSKVEVIYKRGSDGRIFWPNEAIQTTIHVTRVYKGKVPRIVILKSHVGGSLCGWQPAGVGRRQIFAAYVNKGIFRTSSCTMYVLSGRASANPYIKYIRSLPSRRPR